MVDINPINPQSITINVPSNGSLTVNNPGGNTAQVSTNADAQLAYSWACGVGLIQGIDYSAKYWAGKAKESELIAVNAIQDIEDAKDDAIAELESTKDTCLNNIELAGDDKVAEIEGLASDYKSILITLTQRAEIAADNAETSETNAANSAENAAISATSASTSATTANNSASNAAESANLASNSKEDARRYADNAKQDMTKAQTAAGQASDSARSASQSEAVAIQAQATAVTARDAAQGYAQQAEQAKEDIEAELDNYVSNTSLTTILTDYVLSSDLSTTLANYVTSTNLTTILDDYATEQWVNNQRYITSADLPTNYVTTDTAQDISGRKTFLGEKAIYFKQSATTNKLGFTLYNPSSTELGAFEWRPSTIGSGALLNINVPYSSSNYVGFRYWGSPAVNIVAPKVATAGNYYIPTHITDGNTTVTATNAGVVNISTLLPDLTDYVTDTSLATTLADYVTNSALTTTLSDYALLTDIPTVGNGTITINQGGTQKGTFTVNQNGNTTINLDAGGGGGTVDQTFDGTSANAQSGVAISFAKFIQNTATGSNSITILGTAAGRTRATNIGYGSTASEYYSTALGCDASASGYYATALGGHTEASGNQAVALGFHATASGTAAIQIGYGTNSTANTLNIGFYENNTNWQLLNGTTGLIPDARISSNIARISNVPTIDQAFDGTSTNGQSGVSIIDLLDTLYPVGSIYIGTMATCPLQTLGVGTWTLKSSGQVLQGSDANNTAGSSVSASLPQMTANSDGDHSHNRGTMDIKGGWVIRHAANSSSSAISTMSGGSGAISVSSGSGSSVASSLTYNSTNSKVDVATLKASGGWSGSTNTTGAHTHTVEWTDHVGTTVQPNAYVVNIWERIA